MFWPFAKKKEEFKLVDFENAIEFRDVDGTVYNYRPTEDITTHELALLWPLCYATWLRTDLFAYIRRNNLLRHFKQIPKEQ